MIKSESFFQNYFWLKNSDECASQIQFFGIDLDEATLQKAIRNTKRSEELFKTVFSSKFIHANCAAAKIELEKEATLIVSNPPYGERLSAEGLVRDLQHFIDLNKTRILDVFLLLPIGKIPDFKGVRQIKIFPFNNQGLKLNLVGFSNRTN